MKRDQKIVNVQLLRAIAALIVILYHAANHYFSIGGAKSGNLFSFFQQFGYAGVDIFFVISGYIMWITTQRMSGWRGVVGFVYRRLTRIYLGYWPFFLLLVLLLVIYAPQQLQQNDLLDSFFLTYHLPKDALLSVTWTLQYELYFYGFFALMLFVPKSGRLHLLLAVALIILTAQLYAVFVGKMFVMERFASTPMLYRFYLSPFCAEFVAGVLIGLYFERRRLSLKALILGGALALILFFSMLWYQEHQIHARLELGYFQPERVLFFGVISAILVAAAVELEQRGVVLFPGPALALGNASYSLYLSHPILLMLFYFLGLRELAKTSGILPGFWVGLMVFAIIAYSLLHYRWVEAPLMRAAVQVKKRLFP